VRVRLQNISRSLRVVRKGPFARHKPISTRSSIRSFSLGIDLFFLDYYSTIDFLRQIPRKPDLRHAFYVPLCGRYVLGRRFLGKKMEKILQGYQKEKIDAEI
jgi:hypothetical protein